VKFDDIVLQFRSGKATTLAVGWI